MPLARRLLLVSKAERLTIDNHQTTTRKNQTLHTEIMGFCNAVGNISRLVIVAANLLAVSITTKSVGRDRCRGVATTSLTTLSPFTFQLFMQLATIMSCELVSLSGGSKDGDAYGIFFHGTGSNNECETDLYETQDPFVTASRSTICLSMVAGFIAGLMVTFEWLFCEVCCAGVLEGLAFFLAWTSAAATFMFYGTDVCLDDGAKCEYTTASSFLTVAVVCYFGCGLLLCW